MDGNYSSDEPHICHVELYFAKHIVNLDHRQLKFSHKVKKSEILYTKHMGGCPLFCQMMLPICSYIKFSKVHNFLIYEPIFLK